MPIEIIDKLAAKNNGDFKLVDANKVEYSGIIKDADNIQAAVDSLYETINAAPILTYATEEGFKEGQKKYWSIGDEMFILLNFRSSAAGNCVVNILRNGLAYKTETCNKVLLVYL